MLKHMPGMKSLILERLGLALVYLVASSCGDCGGDSGKRPLTTAGTHGGGTGTGIGFCAINTSTYYYAIGMPGIGLAGQNCQTCPDSGEAGWHQSGGDKAEVPYTTNSTGTYMTCVLNKTTGLNVTKKVVEINMNCAAFPVPMPENLKAWGEGPPNAGTLVASAWKSAAIMTSIDVAHAAIGLVAELPGFEVIGAALGMFEGVFNEAGETAELFDELIKWVKEYVAQEITISNLNDIQDEIEAEYQEVKNCQESKDNGTPQQYSTCLINVGTNMVESEGILHIVESSTELTGASMASAAIAYVSQWGCLYLLTMLQAFDSDKTSLNLRNFGMAVNRWSAIFRLYQSQNLEERAKLITVETVNTGLDDTSQMFLLTDSYNGGYQAGLPDFTYSESGEDFSPISTFPLNVGLVGLYNASVHSNWEQYLDKLFDNQATTYESTLKQIHNKVYFNICNSTIPNSTIPICTVQTSNSTGLSQSPALSTLHASAATAKLSCEGDDSCIGYGGSYTYAAPTINLASWGDQSEEEHAAQYKVNLVCRCWGAHRRGGNTLQAQFKYRLGWNVDMETQAPTSAPSMEPTSAPSPERYSSDGLDDTAFWCIMAVCSCATVALLVTWTWMGIVPPERGGGYVEMSIEMPE